MITIVIPLFRKWRMSCISSAQQIRGGILSNDLKEDVGFSMKDRKEKFIQSSELIIDLFVK